MNAVPITWQALPGLSKGRPSSQSLALSCPANEILYDGTRGGGKTDCQLMRFYRLIGMGYGKFWRGIILDLEFKNLDDLVAKSQRWFPQFKNPGRWLSSAADYKWVWKTGEQLLFRQMKHKRDYSKYHGHEYPWIAWNELTKQRTQDLYDLMQSCNRSSFVPEDHPVEITPENEHLIVRTLKSGLGILQDMPLETFSTTNPHGVGHNWVKKYFRIGEVPAGKMIEEKQKVFNPRTRRNEVYTKTRCRIFSSYRENRHLDPAYVATLHKIRDPNRRKAWLEGNWDITAGGAMDDLWKPSVHIVPPFRVPDNWKVDRCMDWGSSHPCSIGFWAEANGEEVRVKKSPRFPTGRWCPIKGSLIQIGEIYLVEGEPGDGINKGLRWGPKRVAGRIIRTEEKLKSRGIYTRKIQAGPADNQIANVNDAETETIKKRFEQHGVYFTESDKSKGTRKQGLEIIRERMGASLDFENGVETNDPGIYFTSDCRASIATIPFLPRDEEDEDDVDTDAEDHPYDMTRYRALKAGWRPATLEDININFA